MDATIAEGMARAKEKDERFLGLFNKLLERRGPNVRIWSCQKAFIHVDSAIVQETSTLPNAKARIRMGHADRRVHTKAQVREGLPFLLDRCLIDNKVACSHTAVVPIGASHASSASPLIHVLFMTRIKVEEGRCSSIDHRYTPSSPHTLIHRASLASISRKRPPAGSCSTTTTAPIAPAPGASGSLKAPPRRSSSSTVTPAIKESSFEVAGPGGIQPLIVQERPENVSMPPTGIPPHVLVPPSSNSPLPPQSTRTDPPPNAIDVAPTVSSERQEGTTQRSSNSLPRSEGMKASPTQTKTKIKRSTRTSVTQKPSAKFASFSLTPSQPGPETRREAPSHLMMPGAFPGTSLDDVDNVDMSSWVLVSPADCQVEVSKRSWFKRMFSRFG
jgi:hypothetical protein